MKPKPYLRAFLVLLWLLAFPASTFAFSGTGSGTEPDPYVITNVEQLQEMQDDLDAHYVLGNDIDASATASWNGGEGFVPIGNDTEPFTGTFDGQGYIITGLFIYRPSTARIGLFGDVRNGAEIKNVDLVDANITGYSKVGALVGYNDNSVISNSSSGGNVTGTESGSVNSRIGGLVGVNTTNASILKCYSTANVTGGAWQNGGLSGYNGHGSVVIDCYARGNVTGNHKVGGLVGDNCYPEGGYVERCYSMGEITGSGGGLIGYNYNGGVTYDSYWDTETSGRTSSNGGTGKTTAEMMQQATFVSWDFVNIWDIVENQGYPFLSIEYGDVVALDIKPQSCPNPLNLESRGVLPVAVLGSEDFDVNNIDVASIRLAGVAPIRSNYEDVATPVADGNECECTAEGPDGYTDLTLKFKTQEIVEKFINAHSELVGGQTLSLTLTGALSNDTLIEGTDCVLLVGNVPKTIAAKRADINGDGVVDFRDFTMLSNQWLKSY